MVSAIEEIHVPSRSAVKRAGDVLKDKQANQEDRDKALDILSIWRSYHSILINTFQATLRKKIEAIGCKEVIIAQRLKRLPSIVAKLERFPSMNLARMQDIGGMRIVLPSVQDVYSLHSNILSSSKRFAHQAVLPPSDYISQPKADGYRSLHQVFKYANRTKPELDGMLIELQIRSKLQHLWATAVETLGVIEKSSFKTGEGDDDIKQFFKLSSSLFALKEQCPVIPEFVNRSRDDLISETRRLEEKLQIFIKLQGIAFSADRIPKKAHYYLMELKKDEQSNGWLLNVRPFTKSQKQAAETLYAAREKETAEDMDVHVVLISVGEMNAIKNAYPNYFLDTQGFIKELASILREGKK